MLGVIGICKDKLQNIPRSWSRILTQNRKSGGKEAVVRNKDATFGSEPI